MRSTLIVTLTLTLALAGALLSACGDIAKPVEADARTEPYTYAGHVDAVPAVNFGNQPPACAWTMTLKNIDVRLTVSLSGVVIGAEVQNDNVEAFQPGTTSTTCTSTLVPPSRAVYNLSGLQPTPTGSMLTLNGATTNRTGANVVVDLSAGTGGYAATLTFHRTDLPAPYDWKVTTMLTLSRI
jgi:hypothetical protein